MTIEEIEQVKSLASAFRRAMERCKPKFTYVAFKDFPQGSCGDTSDLLGRFLGEKGMPGWNYVLGQRGHYTHAWLERDGLCVDITADQFSDAPAPVIVSVGSAWHRQFTVSSTRPVGTSCPLPPFALQIEQSYRLILEELRREE